MRLGDQLVAVEQRDLEVRKVGVEPPPVEIARLVLVHVLPGTSVRVSSSNRRAEQIGSIRVADDLHRRRSATACAASPSPRPVNPRWSVVVARTAICAALDAERAGEPLRHLVANVTDARLLADQHAVGVDELPARLAHLAVGLPEQVERRRAAVLLVARREERADVSEVRRAEERVDERVRDHVAVGVTGETSWIVDRHAAENERHALLERVRVVPRGRPEAPSDERG